MTFWEADIAGTPLFPEGVKLFVADTELLFGTADGEALQLICIKWGWVLAWASGAGDTQQQLQASLRSSAQPAPASSTDRLRIIDPIVAHDSRRLQNRVATADVNVTVSASALAGFRNAWNTANATRAKGGPGALWEALWGEVPPRLRVMGTMRAGLCADADACIGADEHGDCVCYVDDRAE